MTGPPHPGELRHRAAGQTHPARGTPSGHLCIMLREDGDDLERTLTMAEEFKGTEGERAGIDGERRGLQDGANGGQVAAMVMRVFVLVAVRSIVIVIMRMVFMSRSMCVGVIVGRVGVLAVMIVGRVGVVAVYQHASFARGDAAAVDGIKDER